MEAAVEALAGSDLVTKMSFLFMADEGFVSRFQTLDCPQVTIVGDVYLPQPVIDLMGLDVQVFVVADATSSINIYNHATNIQSLYGYQGADCNDEKCIFGMARSVCNV